MKQILGKSIIFILTLVLCACCIGSAFAVYSLDAQERTVELYPFIPASYYLESDWGGWVADNTSKMTYNDGVYTKNDQTVYAGQGFKVYGTDWITTIDSISVPYSGGGLSNISLTNGGIYDFTYDPDEGISVTADVMYYTFKCKLDVAEANAHIYIYLFGGSSSAEFVEATERNRDSYVYYTIPIASDHTGAVVVRFNPDETTIDFDHKWNQSPDYTLTNGIIDTTVNWY